MANGFSTLITTSYGMVCVSKMSVDFGVNHSVEFRKNAKENQDFHTKQQHGSIVYWWLIPIRI